jgi:hypothetical protein
MTISSARQRISEKASCTSRNGMGAIEDSESRCCSYSVGIIQRSGLLVPLPQRRYPFLGPTTLATAGLGW